MSKIGIIILVAIAFILGGIYGVILTEQSAPKTEIVGIVNECVIERQIPAEKFIMRCPKGDYDILEWSLPQEKNNE